MTTAVDLASIDYSFWMKQALSLAEQGSGFTHPNPMVGAIVLDSCGREVGRGFHARAGEAHAEKLAIEEAGSRAQGGTLVVTLEPCCHEGRTPPCTDAILASGIIRVVSAHPDPDPRVRGRGFSQLSHAGIEVKTGVEVAGAERLNRHYLFHRRTGRPWVTLKFAMSLDGRVADVNGRSQWISSPACRLHGHRLRSLHDAILVGGETARRDDPLLSLHDVKGLPPRRFVLQGVRAVPRDLQMFSGAVPATIIGADTRADWLLANDDTGLPDLGAALERMGKEGLTALLVEGGSRTAASFLRSGLVCQVVIYYAPLLLGDGQSALSGIAFPLDKALELSGVEWEALDGGWVVSGFLEAS